MAIAADHGAGRPLGEEARAEAFAGAIEHQLAVLEQQRPTSDHVGLQAQGVGRLAGEVEQAAGPPRELAVAAGHQQHGARIEGDPRRHGLTPQLLDHPVVLQQQAALAIAEGPVRPAPAGGVAAEAPLHVAAVEVEHGQALALAIADPFP